MPDTRPTQEVAQGESSAPDLARLYRLAIERTARMAHDPKVQSLASEFGLSVVNVTWEDAGRFKDSAVGPNISDMTIQVQHESPESRKYELTCMPVIRYPNFSDLTGDISPDEFFLLVGNEKGRPLEKITLRELLESLRNHLTDASSWAGTRSSLLAPERDSHVLVSAQACFLPVLKQGIAKFNPVLFNYQSRKGDPAVLAVLATREGTSVTVIDNQRDPFEAGSTWGQRIFFNSNGERSGLTGERRSDFAARQQGTATDGATAQPADREGLNMVLLIQVPLKQKETVRSSWNPDESAVFFLCGAAACLSADIEDAVIGHGEVEGPFTEIDQLEIERDARYPVRVTVQFYKATSNGIVTHEDMEQIAAQIERVYRQADYVGSLVVQGETGRPTEHGGPNSELPGWWEQFWERHFANTGQTPGQVIGMLEKLLGADWAQKSLQAANTAAERAAKPSKET